MRLWTTCAEQKALYNIWPKAKDDILQTIYRVAKNGTVFLVRLNLTN